MESNHDKLQRLTGREIHAKNDPFVVPYVRMPQSWTYRTPVWVSKMAPRLSEYGFWNRLVKIAGEYWRYK